MEAKLKRIIGRVHYYEDRTKRVDGVGRFMPVSESLWGQLFGNDLKTAEVKKVVVAKVVPEKPVEKIIKTNGRGRPRKEVVGIRAMQKRRKADGLSKGVGRPKNNSLPLRYEKRQTNP